MSRLKTCLALVGAGLGIAGIVDRLLAFDVLVLGIPSERPIRTSELVRAPIDVVWEALSDVHAQPAWMHEMRSLEITTPGPLGPGSRGIADVRILGIGVKDPVEIVAVEPPTRYALRHLGLVSGRGEIRLEGAVEGSSTVVTWDEWLIPPLFPELGTLLMRPILARVFRDDLRAFRRLVEDGDLPR